MKILNRCGCFEENQTNKGAIKMKLIHQVDKFRYQVLKTKSFCLLRVYQTDLDKIFIIATELKDNPGMSITNAIETVMSQAVLRFGFNPNEVILIEHYNDNDVYGSQEELDRFDRIKMQWNNRFECYENPGWFHVGSGEFNKLLELLDNLKVESK